MWKFIGAVLAAGMAATWLAWPDSFASFWPVAVPAVLVCFLAEWRAPYIPGYGALNCAEAVYFALALEYGGAPAALLAAGVGIVADSMLRKSAAVRIFNIGWALLTFTTVGLTGQTLGYAEQPVPVVVAAGLVYFVVSGGLQAAMQALLHEMTMHETLHHQARLMRYSLLSTLFIGAVAIALLNRNPWLLLLLAFPMELLSALIEKDRLHRELLAAQGALVEAEKRAALGVMAAGVAHEINTPLGAIVTNAHMLRDPRLTGAERDHCLSVVEKAAMRAREITDGLLGNARESGAPASDPKEACMTQ